MTQKKRSILNLTPQWIMFDQFWISLKTRNLWLIQLRYAACIMLLGLIIADFIISSITLPVVPLAFLAVSIAGYNVIFHYSIRYLPPAYAPFHGLHFALIQIIADFISLAILIYYTGGMESPFY